MHPRVGRAQRFQSVEKAPAHAQACISVVFRLNGVEVVAGRRALPNVNV